MKKWKHRRNISEVSIRFKLAIGLLTLLSTSLLVQAVPKATTVVKQVTAEDGVAQTRVRLELSQKPTFTVFSLKKPSRLFIDVSNATLGDVVRQVDVKNGVVRTVQLATVKNANLELVRLTVELELDALYNVEAQGNSILISVDNSERIESAVVARTTTDDKKAQAAELRAAQAERRAQLAEQRAKETETALAQAQSRAVENAARADSLREEAKVLRISQRERLRAASARAASAEARLSEIQAMSTTKISFAQRQAEDAYQRADRAENAAVKRQAQAEALARTQEADALSALSQFALQAQQLERRAVNAEKRAQEAESEFLETRRRLNSLSTEVSASAQAALASVQDTVERTKKEAQLFKEQANAAEQAVEQRLAIYRGRARAAELTAEQTSAQVEEEKAAKQEEITALTQSVVRAESMAVQADTKLQETRSELASLRQERAREQELAKQKIADLEEKARAAESRALQAATETEARAKQASEALKVTSTKAAKEIAVAKAESLRMEAELKRAEARSQSAKTRAAEAERLALEAAERTRTLSDRADEAQRNVERLQSQIKGIENREAVRIAQAQALVEATALEKAELAERLRRAELEQAQTQSRIEALLVAQQNALARNEVEREKNETQSRAAAEAERRARTAELEIEKSRVARLKLEQRMTSLQSELATVKAERSRLEGQGAERSEGMKESLAQANKRINALTAQLEREVTERDQAAKTIASSQDALSEAKQKALDAQTKLALANEKLRKAELARVQEKRRADAAEAQATANQERAIAAEAQATANQERADEASVKLVEASDEIRAAREAAKRESQRADEAEAIASKHLEEARAASERLAKSEESAQAAIVAASEAKAMAEQAQAEAASAKEKAERVRLEQSKTTATLPIAPRAEIFSVPPIPQRKLNRISDIGFATDGGDQVIRIESSDAIGWSLMGEGLTTQTLVLSSSQILPILERTLDTTDFGGNIKLVSSFQAPSTVDQVHVVVTMSSPLDGRIVERGNQLEWRFPMHSSVSPRAIGSVPPPAWQQVTSMNADGARVAPYTGLNQIASPTERTGPRGTKRYRGRKINVDIKDGDIHNVLRILAKTGNVNIVTSDEVSGTVTMHLKLVPWDQALDMVLRTKGLDMVREGDIIRVAPSEMIAQEREAELKKLEVRERLKPLEIKMITVNHANAEELIPRIKSVLSKRGTAEFDTRTNTVIVKDVDDHLDAAEDMIRRLDTQTPQVLIETRIVEVNEVNVKQLGIQWGMDSVWSAATGNPTGLRFPSSIGISGGADDQQGVTEGVSTNPNFVVNLPASAGAGSGGALGLSFGSIDSTFNLNVRLSALENRGSVKIVSSPKITTLDNKKARISQGVSIPISQVSATGVQTVFFDAVLALEVQPHVTQDGNIYLNLKAENNTPDFQNVAARGDPTILKKEASTELLLRDGDTTVIGGIYTSNAGVNSSEVPFFGSIPILGALFRNHQQSDRRTELLIFVTPRIVNRAAATVRTVR